MDARLGGDEIESLVVEAGRACGIQAGRDEVRRALEDPAHGPAFAQWAALHLGSDNLITPDEMALYAALDKSGEVDRLAGLHDLAEVQAVTEDEVRIATDELRRSTQAISKQADALRQQRDALSRLVTKTSENGIRRHDFEQARQRRSESERHHISAEVDGLSQSLGFRISDIVQQSDVSGDTLSGLVGESLQADDKLLSSLQKLSRELDQQDPEEAKTIERLREICARLIKNTVESLRVKLDRVYLDSLTEAQYDGGNRHITGEEVQSLQEEVETLYSEILPVAQMSVERKYLEPALKSLSSQSGRGLARSAAAITYINSCLDHLLDRTDRLRETLGSFRSHQAASTSLIETASNELAVTTEPPSRTRMPAIPASPVRPRANTRSARRSSGFQELPAIDSLLQSLAIRLDDGADGRVRAQTLAKALAERSTKESEVAHSVQESFESAVATHLDDTRRALQLLKDSVLADSPFGDVRLVDPEIESSINYLSGEVNKARGRLDRAEARASTEKSEKRAEIIQRWG